MAKESLTIRLATALDTVLGREPMPRSVLNLEPPELKADMHHASQGSGAVTYWGPNWQTYQHNQSYDHVRDNLTGSSVVMAAVNWLATTLPEAPFQVLRDKDGKASADLKHPLTRMMRRPNQYHAGSNLMKSFALSWLCDGNVYWQMVRNARGVPVELWYIPHFMIEPYWPQGDDSVFIQSYKYTVNGKHFYIPPEDIVHFKYGTDPNNTRKGLSPLGSALCEIFTGTEVANFAASLLRNMGMATHMLSPKEGQSFASDTDAVAAKAQFESLMSGANRGKVIVNTIPIDVERMAFSPAEMDLSKLRHLSEVAVSSLTNIPSAVLQYMIGQENGTSYASYKEAGAQGIETVVKPTWNYIAEELDAQLLPEFEKDIDSVWCDFDTSQVAALQENADSLSKRTCMEYSAGIIMRATAKEKLGVPVIEGEDSVYSAPPSRFGGGAPEPTEEEVNSTLDELAKMYGGDND